MNKPRVGISACLLGKKVRHDGGDKRNEWLVESLGKYVEWHPVCPEMEMGLGVPRKTLKLIGTQSHPQMIVKDSAENITQRAYDTSERILGHISDLDSYILKKDSPSCGLERVKIYDKNNCPAPLGTGLFALKLKEKICTKGFLAELAAIFPNAS